MRHYAHIDKEAAFEKSASWEDVRAKAQAIVTYGGVEIYRDDAQEVGAYVMSGVVEGLFPVTDGGPYDVILSKRSWENENNVGGWVQAFFCDCIWGQYHSGSPGGSSRWSGRMCSHSLATLMVSNARARGDFFGDRTASADWEVGDYDGERAHIREYPNGCTGVILKRKYWTLLDSVGNVVDEGREQNLAECKATCDLFSSMRTASNYSKDNFYEGTRATWVPCNAPEAEPDFVSDSGSMYWYYPEGVVRGADHWGNDIGDCNWHMLGDEHYSAWFDDNDVRYGFCPWQGFESNLEDDMGKTAKSEYTRSEYDDGCYGVVYDDATFEVFDGDGNMLFDDEGEEYRSPLDAWTDMDEWAGMWGIHKMESKMAASWEQDGNEWEKIYDDGTRGLIYVYDGVYMVDFWPSDGSGLRTFECDDFVTAQALCDDIHMKLEVDPDYTSDYLKLYTYSLGSRKTAGEEGVDWWRGCDGQPIYVGDKVVDDPDYWDFAMNMEWTFLGVDGSGNVLLEVDGDVLDDQYTESEISKCIRCAAGKEGKMASRINGNRRLAYMQPTTFEPDSTGYKVLSQLAVALHEQCPSCAFRVETIYFDYGQDWKWTTIVAYRNGDSWQALNPAEWQYALETGDLGTVVDEVLHGDYGNLFARKADWGGANELSWGSDDEYLKGVYDDSEAAWKAEGEPLYAPWHIGDCPRCGCHMKISDEKGICYNCAKAEWGDYCRYCYEPLNGFSVDGYCCQEHKDKQLRPHMGKRANVDFAAINKMVEFGLDLYKNQFKSWQSLVDIQQDEDVQYYKDGLDMVDEDWQEGCRRLWEEISMTASRTAAHELHFTTSGGGQVAEFDGEIVPETWGELTHANLFMDGYDFADGEAEELGIYYEEDNELDPWALLDWINEQIDMGRFGSMTAKKIAAIPGIDFSCFTIDSGYHKGEMVSVKHDDDGWVITLWDGFNDTRAEWHTLTGDYSFEDALDYAEEMYGPITEVDVYDESLDKYAMTCDGMWEEDLEGVWKSIPDRDIFCGAVPVDLGSDMGIIWEWSVMQDSTGYVYADGRAWSKEEAMSLCDAEAQKQIDSTPLGYDGNSFFDSPFEERMLDMGYPTLGARTAQAGEWVEDPSTGTSFIDWGDGCSGEAYPEGDWFFSFDGKIMESGIEPTLWEAQAACEVEHDSFDRQASRKMSNDDNIQVGDLVDYYYDDFYNGQLDVYEGTYEVVDIEGMSWRDSDGGYNDQRKYTLKHPETGETFKVTNGMSKTIKKHASRKMAFADTYVDLIYIGGEMYSAETHVEDSEYGVWVVSLHIAPEGADADGYFEGSGSGDSLTEAVNDALEQAGAIQLMSSDEREDYIGNLKFCVEDDMKYAGRKRASRVADNGVEGDGWRFESSSPGRFGVWIKDYGNGWEGMIRENDMLSQYNWYLYQDGILISEDERGTLEDAKDGCDETAHRKGASRKMAAGVGWEETSYGWTRDYDKYTCGDIHEFEGKFVWSLGYVAGDNAQTIADGVTESLESAQGQCDFHSRLAFRKKAGVDFGDMRHTLDTVYTTTLRDEFGDPLDLDIVNRGDGWEWELSNQMNGMGPFADSDGNVWGSPQEALDDFNDWVNFNANGSRRLASRKSAGVDWEAYEVVDGIPTSDVPGHMFQHGYDGWYLIKHDDDWGDREFGPYGSLAELMSVHDLHDGDVKTAQMYVDTFEYGFYSPEGFKAGMCHIENEEGSWICELYGVNDETWDAYGAGDTWVQACKNAIGNLPFAIDGDEVESFIAYVQFSITEHDYWLVVEGSSKKTAQDYEVDIYNTLDGWDGWAEVYENADGVWGWEVSKYNDGSDYAGEYVDSNFAFDTPDEAFDDLWGQDRYIEAGRKVAFPSSLDDFDFDSTWDTYYYEDGSVAVHLMEVDDNAWWVDVEWPDGASVTNEQLGDECSSADEAIAWAKKTFESPVRGAKAEDDLWGQGRHIEAGRKVAWGERGTTPSGIEYSVSPMPNPSWGGYDMSVGQAMMDNFGEVYLDTYGSPYDDEYIWDEIREDLGRTAGRRLDYDDDIVVIKSKDGDEWFKGTWDEAKMCGYSNDELLRFDGDRYELPEGATLEVIAKTADLDEWVNDYGDTWTKIYSDGYLGAVSNVAWDDPSMGASYILSANDWMETTVAKGDAVDTAEARRLCDEAHDHAAYAARTASEGWTEELGFMYSDKGVGVFTGSKVAGGWEVEGHDFVKYYGQGEFGEVKGVCEYLLGYTLYDGDVVVANGGYGRYAEDQVMCDQEAARYLGGNVAGRNKKSASKRVATRQFTYAEMKELEDEIEGTELHNADRFKDGGADYYAAL